MHELTWWLLVQGGMPPPPYQPPPMSYPPSGGGGGGGYGGGIGMGGGGGGFRPSAGISPAVTRALEQLYSRGTVFPGEIDDKCMGGLASLPEYLAVEAVQDFSCRDLSQIRNKSAYFMGCINKRRTGGSDGCYSQASCVLISFGSWIAHRHSQASCVLISFGSWIDAHPYLSACVASNVSRP
jgi:hypothetical protein